MISFPAAQPTELHWKYLSPTGNGGVMQKGQFVRSDQDYVYLKTSKTSNTYKVQMKDLIIDRPPKKESLHPNAEVLIPVEYKVLNQQNVRATCGTWESKTKQTFAYVSGTFIKSYNGKFLVKAAYIRK